ncbi:MAG: polysaccharide deacetylase family protein [Proteobacteria bacterium]|nr:polysaccharide deacetylase family protein [Pseudomonadota bacterium]
MLFLTSWDDGHPSDLRLAELLNKYDLKGTFFVPVTNKEGYEVLDSAQLKVLDKNFEIGGHTLSHSYLQGLPHQELNNEIVRGKEIIEDILGHSIDGFCYPGGVFDRKVIQAVKSAGFSYARTVENLCFDLGESAWEMPTSFQFYPHSAYVFAKNSLKYLKISKINIVKMRWSESDFLRFMEKQLILASYQQSVFHIWGHSWELDEFHLWNKLEMFFKLLANFPIQAMTLAEANKLNKS